jgi:hypothetical protein
MEQKRSRRRFLGVLGRLAAVGAGSLVIGVGAASKAQACAIWCQVILCDYSSICDPNYYQLRSVYRCRSRCDGSTFTLCKDWLDCRSFCYSRNFC